MKKAVNVVCFEGGRLLLVKKGEVWILPGGKPKKGEDDKDCLKREISEELPKVRVEGFNFIGKVIGLTPHKKYELTAFLYFGILKGSFLPGAEISESRLVTRVEAEKLPLSDITRKTVEILIEEGFF